MTGIGLVSWLWRPVARLREIGWGDVTLAAFLSLYAIVMRQRPGQAPHPHSGAGRRRGCAGHDGAGGLGAPRSGRRRCRGGRRRGGERAAHRPDGALRPRPAGGVRDRVLRGYPAGRAQAGRRRGVLRRRGDHAGVLSTPSSAPASSWPGCQSLRRPALPDGWRGPAAWRRRPCGSGTRSSAASASRPRGSPWRRTGPASRRISTTSCGTGSPRWPPPRRPGASWSPRTRLERAGAFAAVENSGRATLTQMREVVGTLREEGLTGPQPVLAQLGSLLESATSADARLQVEGSPRALPAGVELSAYRIVEHLLAALQDAPEARIDVRVRFGPGRAGAGRRRPRVPARGSGRQRSPSRASGSRCSAGRCGSRPAPGRCAALVRLPLTARLCVLLTASRGSQAAGAADMLVALGLSAFLLIYLTRPGHAARREQPARNGLRGLRVFGCVILRRSHPQLAAVVAGGCLALAAPGIVRRPFPAA